MNRLHRTERLLFLVLPLILLFLSACAAKLTPNLSHQGRLLDENGSPVADGNYDVEYKIYQAASGGTAVYTETSTVSVEDGLFTNALGLTTAIDPTIFAQPTWLEVTINGETLTPRQRLQGSPFAFSLVSGSTVQGAQPLARTYAGQEDTGASLSVLNNDATATGGHGLLAINRAAATGDDRAKVAAFQARAVGGDGPNGTGAYGAIIYSEGYRGLYARGGPPSYFAGVFDSPTGIYIIGGGGCTNCALAYNAMNVGDGPIAAGDFVAVVGVELDAELNIPVMQVRKATSASDAVIGVAAGAAVRDTVGEHNGVTTGGFEGASGPAAAGGYLSVVVQGLVQARAADAGLQPGASINAGVDGAVAAAGGFTRALSAVDGNGMVWVMLSGQ